ncbi:hypothetical protein P8452_03302 [Trifolium repens]|nr:hypothetical protein P8452_03302 [Trifolium repens]
MLLAPMRFGFIDKQEQMKINREAGKSIQPYPKLLCAQKVSEIARIEGKLIQPGKIMTSTIKYDFWFLCILLYSSTVDNQFVVSSPSTPSSNKTIHAKSNQTNLSNTSSPDMNFESPVSFVCNNTLGEASIGHNIDLSRSISTVSVSGAKHNFWLEERAEKSRPGHADVEFSICCQKGFVDLPLLKKPPALLVSLLNGTEPRIGSLLPENGINQIEV